MKDRFTEPDKTIEDSMRTALQFLEEIDPNRWIQSEAVPLDKEQKKKILTNMMLWFASPENEEYETSAKLKKIIDENF